MLPQSVVAYLEAHRQEHLETLFELLRIASIANYDDDGCDRAVAWLTQHLKTMGFAVKVFPTPGKPNILAERTENNNAPTLLIYGHYDVQPPDPLALWETPPFEPTVRDGWIYARGADDDKGQLFAHLMAIDAWQKAAGGVPVNLKIFLEGEEEICSPNMEAFLADHRQKLSADAAVISDSAFFADGLPSLTYALRGLVYTEVTVFGPDCDLHCGLHGGPVVNPIHALSHMIAQMHDTKGRITLPGFYDDVLPLSDTERRSWAALQFDPQTYAAEIGVNELAGGEEDFSCLERLWARPTLDCNGIVGGYTAQGAKSILPSQASAKLSMRLVPHQDPDKIVEGFRQFISEHTPAGVRVHVAQPTTTRAVLLDQNSRAMKAAKLALQETFDQREPVMIRCGASVPITELIQRYLGIDAVLLGFGLPEDRLHSPNERFKLDQLYRAAAACAAFYQNLAELS